MTVPGSARTVPVALRAVTVQAWFANNDAEIEPGVSTTLALTVTNLGNSTDSFALTPTGLAAAWSTIRPAYITLFGGSQETVEVEVSAPRLPSTTAGPTSLGVRVVPQGSPDDVESAEITLHVASTFDRRIQMLQPAIRTRRRALFELMVENQGNSQASCRMHLIDPTGRLDGDFDPPAVGIEPGGSTLVRLKLRAVRRQWERRSRSVPFRVEADQQGAPTAEATAALIQAPMLPERLWLRVGTLAGALALALAGWYGLVRPAIDDAAADAVAELEPVATTPTTVADGIPGTTTAPVQIEDTAEGDPFSIGLPSGSALGETSSQLYTAPSGKRFLVTDLTVQNAFGDEGIATLTVGTQRFEFDLINLEGFDWQRSFVTPIQLLPGETVVFEVSCGSVGQLGSATCSAAAIVNGRLVDV